MEIQTAMLTGDWQDPCHAGKVHEGQNGRRPIRVEQVCSVRLKLTAIPSCGSLYEIHNSDSTEK